MMVCTFFERSDYSDTAAWGENGRGFPARRIVGSLLPTIMKEKYRKDARMEIMIKEK